MAKVFQVDTGGTLTTNLTNYFKLEDESDFWDTNTLTNGNSVTFTSAKVNNGANFGSTNTNKYLHNGDANDIGGGNNSISLWVKLLAEIGAGEWEFIQIKGGDPSVTLRIFYLYNGGTRKLRFRR